MITTDAPPMNELVEDGVSGLLFTPGNSSEAADALERLVKHPELRERLGCAARSRVEQLYDLSVNARELAEYIRTIISEV